MASIITTTETHDLGTGGLVWAGRRVVRAAQDGRFCFTNGATWYYLCNRANALACFDVVNATITYYDATTTAGYLAHTPARQDDDVAASMTRTLQRWMLAGYGIA
jgi:hypothetical protein